MVGAILYEPPAALPADLQTFMDQCNGVIYVSMGTMAVLTTPELLSLSGAFASLHECVIWKLKDFPGDSRLPAQAGIVLTQAACMSWISHMLQSCGMKAAKTHQSQ